MVFISKALAQCFIYLVLLGDAYPTKRKTRTVSWNSLPEPTLLEWPGLNPGLFTVKRMSVLITTVVKKKITKVERMQSAVMETTLDLRSKVLQFITLVTLGKLLEDFEWQETSLSHGNNQSTSQHTVKGLHRSSVSCNVLHVINAQ